MKPLLLLSLLAATGCSTAPSTGGGARTVNQRSTAPSSCSMGFRELFQLAKGRDWTQDEVQAFQKLDQPGKNAMVSLPSR